MLYRCFVRESCNSISIGGGAVLLGADSTILDDNATQVIISSCTFTDNISRLVIHTHLNCII
jgi:hypothetical protein